MEEIKDDIIYDLEAPASHAESAEEQGAPNPDNSEASELSGDSDSSDDSDISDDSGSSDPSDPARAEIDRMVEDMGAGTLLEIIRDNRNAAIRQIISEVEASRTDAIPSGSSVAGECSSIFDLAALA